MTTRVRMVAYEGNDPVEALRLITLFGALVVPVESNELRDVTDDVRTLAANVKKLDETPRNRHERRKARRLAR